jgi:hypothetical protein
MSDIRARVVRAVKISALIVVGVPLTFIVAVVVWFVFVAVASAYKWGWVDVPVHYGLTFGVEVGGVVYTGTTVVQVTYERQPGYQLINSPGIASYFEGQAGCIPLPDEKAICLIPGARNLSRTSRTWSVANLADRLLSVDGSPTGPKAHWTGIYASNAQSVSGGSEIPPDLLPPIVIFENVKTPSSAHLLDPEHPEQFLGSGARFLGANIAVSQDKLSVGIEKALPFLNDPKVTGLLSKAGDPILGETFARMGLTESEFYSSGACPPAKCYQPPKRKR